MKIKRIFLNGVVLALFASSSFASTYDDEDDDIYYNPSKDKKEQKKQPGTVVKTTPQGQVYVGTDGNTYVVTDDGYAYPTAAIDFQGSDNYVVNSGSTRDVDEYNRRTSSVSTGTATGASAESHQDFANTRRIERFSNPDVVISTGDDDLIEQYYGTSSDSPTEVNIYLNSTPYWSSAYATPYYFWTSPYYSTWNAWNAWAWGWDPWYAPSWYNPYWSWSWGYDPYWGPSWSWGWGGPYRPAWRPTPPPRPSSPGSYRPHRPSRPNSGMASTRPGGSGGYRGNNTHATRPSASSNLSRPSDSYQGGRRPSSGSVNGGGRAYRPSASSVINQNQSSGYRGQSSGTNVGGGRRGSSSNSSNSGYRSNNNNNRQSSSSSSYRSSSGSSRSSSGSHRSSSGGSRSGGGRSGGGGRR